ncbi:Mpv17/PMP22 family protein [Aspergillus homomorphus CBS 101889]|uniref:Integral membrane protein, Mpv17/PMP22 family n=1 Tax=Aspergillus homomorphus (strain CBS 101889) TaxID=1450537 RepID=A0A395IFW3_ASPHC|nr:hypothetical protein BO97DRAFT_360769 [Aspergillus homomorphus CBS 101889]RAL17084.1 hypothetical protein BO97DRAFT_360769 [Aspergillus homomorphus CBS 101889]
MSATIFGSRTFPRPPPLSRSLRPRRCQSSTPSRPEPPNASPPPNAQSAASASGVPVVPTSTAVQSGSRSLLQIIQAGPVGRVARAYSRVQERRPYATQLWSSVIIYLCGDLSAQLLFPADPAPATAATQLEGKKNDKPGTDSQGEEEKTGGGYDPLRTLRHLTVGIGSSIPTFKWFMFLHNNFNYSSKFLSILTKVCVQQAVFTPVFNTYFFGLQSLLTGKPFEETFERLKLALPVSISNSVKLWPAVTAFSFMYVPPQFRSIFSGVIAVGWQTYLSWLNQKAAREVEAEMAEIPESVSTGADTAAMKA